MEPGPLPPHERSWRHPSELGPTRYDVEEPRSNSHFLALAGGTMAVLAVAVMVVAMTPRTSSGPVALSATTTPITARAIVEPPTAPTEPTEPTEPTVRSLLPTTAALLTSFAALPHAVTAGPQLDLDGTDVADTLPAGDDMVLLRTEAVTYQLAWAEVQLLDPPDGSVVFDTEGDLVAWISGGEFVALVVD